MATQPGLDTYRDALGSAFHLKADIDVADEVLVALPAQKAALGDVGMTRLTEEVARLLDGAPRSIGLLPDLGTFHAVFRIEATDGGVFYARTNLPAVPWPALDFAVDEWISATLGRRGLPVPAVRHVDLSRTRLPFDLEIVEAAAGESLTPGPATAPALEALGASVARLHTFGCRRFGLLDPASLDSERPPAGVHPTWSDYLLLNLDDHVAACHATGALTSAEAAATRAAFVEAEVLLAAAPSVLLHGDLSNRNVLVERGRIGTLLDWEDSLAGDPVFDIAGWGSFVGNHQRRDIFLEGYRTVATLPTDFELRYWLYYLRIMLAKTVHRRRFGYAPTDHIPAATRLRPALEALSEHFEKG